jgi:hypothetical protein
MTRLDMIQLTITRIVLTSGPRVGRRVELLARMYAPVQVATPRRYRLKGFEAANGIAIPVGLKDTDTLNPIKAAVFVDLVHVVVNSNEFSYRF